MGTANTTMDIRNKVCIITGGAQGLGKAFAARLLEAGAKVCISDINQEVGDKALEELKERFGPDNVCFVACDVCQEEQFTALFDRAEQFFRVSCVDLLANNAGVNTNFGWRKCMEVNIISVMLGTELAMERMRKAGKAGQIINTASMAGLAPGLNEEMTPYTVSKHGVVALTRTLAKVSTGISHKCLCPAWTDTNMVSSAVKVDVKNELGDNIKSRGGLMTPEHVAEGFFRLVTECDNGSAMAVNKGCPYILLPDCSIPLIVILVALSKLVTRALEPQVVTGRHLLAALSILLFIFCFVITLIF